MDLQVVDGFYILSIDKGILVLTREQFIDGLRRGKWWKRRQSLSPREAVMQEHAEETRSRVSSGSKR